MCHLHPSSYIGRLAELDMHLHVVDTAQGRETQAPLKPTFRLSSVAMSFLKEASSFSTVSSDLFLDAALYRADEYLPLRSHHQSSALTLEAFDATRTHTAQTVRVKCPPQALHERSLHAHHRGYYPVAHWVVMGRPSCWLVSLLRRLRPSAAILDAVWPMKTTRCASRSSSGGQWAIEKGLGRERQKP